MMNSICTIEGCGRPVFARGWCDPHWKSATAIRSVADDHRHPGRHAPFPGVVGRIRRAAFAASIGGAGASTVTRCWVRSHSRRRTNSVRGWPPKPPLPAPRLRCQAASAASGRFCNSGLTIQR